MKTDKEKIDLLTRKLDLARLLFIDGLDRIMSTKYIPEKNPYLKPIIKEYDKLIRETK